MEFPSAEELQDATVTFSSKSYLLSRMRQCLSYCESARKLSARHLLMETTGYYRYMSRCNASTNQSIVRVDQIRSARMNVTKKLSYTKEPDCGFRITGPQKASKTLPHQW